MKHYEDLVKQLRDGTGLPVLKQLMNRAANAIEELLAINSGLRAGTTKAALKMAQMHALSLEEREVFLTAIEKWGAEAQIMMVFEEMSELQKELCKNYRGNTNVESIADEVADVEIMLAQLKIIFGIESSVRKHRKAKIDRLMNRLGMKP